jgi:hypothetical protein
MLLTFCSHALILDHNNAEIIESKWHLECRPRRLGSRCLALGTGAVMMGGLLTGTTEAPGEYPYHEGERVKAYQGIKAMEQGKPSMKH